MFKKFELPEVGELTIYKRASSRGMRLSITSKGEIRVSIPAWAPYQAGLAFAKTRTDWILLQLAKTEQPVLQEGQQIGRQHRLHFAIKFQADTPTSRIANSVITVTHPASLKSEHISVQKIAERAAIKALRAEAEAYLPGRIRDLAREHGYTYKSVSVKQLKRRWGSCDQDKNIVFNLFLMQLPLVLIDYVIMHELTHTQHMDHSDAFWKSFEDHFPHAREYRRQMRDHEPKLAAGIV